MDKTDYIGRQFGKLTVLGLERAVQGAENNPITKFIVRCVCGSERAISKYHILNGTVKSCGCGKSSGTKERPLYSTWINMKRRCRAADTGVSTRYENINVYAGWLEDFVAFETYVLSALGERPSEEHSLDRIDNASDYAPGNIRWATAKEQARNRSSNKRLATNNEVLTLAEWAERTKISPQALYQRSKRGWSPEETVSRPKRSDGIITANGVTKHVSEWSKECGVTANTILRRIAKFDWTPEDAVSKGKNKSLTINGETKTCVEWSKTTGVPVTTIYQRLDRGWDPERAVSEKK